MHKRDRLSQMAFLTIATLMLPITTTKGQGFYVELFLIHAYLLELKSKISILPLLFE